uniref:Uncharacterized protein n=1 Tax=Panagrolaimus sp. JU765 TaxID=591449 RepID=A0AC34QIJ1_9BILA
MESSVEPTTQNILPDLPFSEFRPDGKPDWRFYRARSIMKKQRQMMMVETKEETVVNVVESVADDVDDDIIEIDSQFPHLDDKPKDFFGMPQTGTFPFKKKSGVVPKWQKYRVKREPEEYSLEEVNDKISQEKRMKRALKKKRQRAKRLEREKQNQSRKQKKEQQKILDDQEVQVIGGNVVDGKSEPATIAYENALILEGAKAEEELRKKLRLERRRQHREKKRQIWGSADHIDITRMRRNAKAHKKKRRKSSKAEGPTQRAEVVSAKGIHVQVKREIKRELIV